MCVGVNVGVCGCGCGRVGMVVWMCEYGWVWGMSMSVGALVGGYVGVSVGVGVSLFGMWVCRCMGVSVGVVWCVDVCRCGCVGV